MRKAIQLGVAVLLAISASFGSAHASGQETAEQLRKTVNDLVRRLDEVQKKLEAVEKKQAEQPVATAAPTPAAAPAPATQYPPPAAIPYADPYASAPFGSPFPAQAGVMPSFGAPPYAPPAYAPPAYAEQAFPTPSFPSSSFAAPGFAEPEEDAFDSAAPFDDARQDWWLALQRRGQNLPALRRRAVEAARSMPGADLLRVQGWWLWRGCAWLNQSGYLHR